MRYTKADVKGMFSRLARAMGKREDAGMYDGLVLDYAPIYGGYVIEELGSKGSCSHPFGSVRRNAREMYLSMWMAAVALEELKYKQELLNKYEMAS
jgi:hypothetical protein